jgi:hypothetical protein
MTLHSPDVLSSASSLSRLIWSLKVATAAEKDASTGSGAFAVSIFALHALFRLSLTTYELQQTGTSSLKPTSASAVDF